jgi:flavin reductase (DIM6/NTAB) family NADH-FMN oxidoreductase RutF
MSMEIDPSHLEISERYKLLIGCIVPRPIALVSTVSPRGEHNLAPFSFFNGAGTDPWTVLFCPANKPDGTEKDTLRNCKPIAEGGTGVFVVNVAVEAYYRETAAAGEALPHGESEFSSTGLAPAPSRRVRAPRLAASPVAFECKTWKVIRTNPGAPGGGNIVIGQIVHVHLRDDLVSERLHVDPARLQAIGRMGGSGYCTTRSRFEVPYGRAALELPKQFPIDD